MAYFSAFSFLQDNLEVHYSGFKTNDIHNLSDLVQENLGSQVCLIFHLHAISNSSFVLACSTQLQIGNRVIDFFPSVCMSPGKKVWSAASI